MMVFGLQAGVFRAFEMLLVIRVFGHPEFMFAERIQFRGLLLT